MLLTIDVGNTETVFGVYDGAALKAHGRFSSVMQRTADEAWLVFRMWCDAERIEADSLNGVVISSVVPNLTPVFSDMSARHLQIEPLVVSTETVPGIKVRYESPGTVGADRLCNAVAGYSAYGGPLVVVDFGTATTFDAISAAGEYLGGVICLGLNGASQELHRVAAKLPKVDLAFPPNVIGRTTETSIQSGILWGAAVLVDGLVERIGTELGRPDVTAVATGGLAGMVAAHCRRIQHVDPFLTLEGMRLIYERAHAEGSS
jgi:type III pantothenate kinase